MSKATEVGHTIGRTGPLQFELLPNGMSAILLRTFVVKTLRGRTVIVPSRFKTDFASVPRIFWRIVPPWGAYSPAAVIHDYLYATGEVSKKEADLIFLELMKRLHVKKWKRNIMYWAVRVGGKPAWNRHRKKRLSVKR